MVTATLSLGKFQAIQGTAENLCLFYRFSLRTLWTTVLYIYIYILANASYRTWLLSSQISKYVIAEALRKKQHPSTTLTVNLGVTTDLVS
jgi:hypothetical protein